MRNLGGILKWPPLEYHQQKQEMFSCVSVMLQIFQIRPDSNTQIFGFGLNEVWNSAVFWWGGGVVRQHASHEDKHINTQSTKAYDDNWTAEASTCGTDVQNAYSPVGLCLYEGIQTDCDGEGTSPSHDPCRHSQALGTGSLSSLTAKNLNDK